MANTVTLLSYANTFGDWVVTTNKLAQENNDLAANNYVKPTGTLFLNSPTLGLQVANNAVVQGQLQVSGIGSSAYVQKNLQVDGQIIGAGNNYFITSDSNTIFTLTQSGNGLALRINPQPGGSGQFGANSTVIDANGNVYIGSASAGTFKLNVANGNVNFSNNLTVGSNITSQIVRTTNHTVSKDITASANILGDRIQANTNLISPTLAVSGTAYVYYVQANNTVNTETLTVSSSAIVNNLRGNTYVWAPTIVGSSNVIANTIVANTTIDAATADLYIDDVVANTISVQGNFIISGDIVYNTDMLTINADAAVPQTGTFASHRGPGNANAEIRWNESQDYWDIRDVNNPTSYSKILTANLISDSLTSTSSSTVASSNAIYSVQNAINSQIAPGITATNILATAAYGKANAEGTINNTQNTWITNTNTFAQAAFNRVNTAILASNTFIGTTGSATPSVGVISFNSTNGVTVSGAANVLTISTSQDLRTTASPTFNGLTLTNPLAISSGGTGATSAGAALTALLPTGTTSGYVLTTGGPGSFYWAAGGGGGGGGATPGTTINSTRLSYTGNGVTSAYTTPTYVPGASQLRVYFDGVRQFASTYTETSNTSVTFATPIPNGVAVLLEVDGYINNPYYANNIAYTINANISPTANTIQLAIDGLTAKLVTYYANTNGGTQTFNNVVLAPTPTINSSTGNTQIATTAFVNNKANSGVTFTASVTGSAGSVASSGIVGTITNAQLAGSITNDKLAGSITNAKLAGPTVTVTDDNSTNATRYPLFASGTSSTVNPTFNASTSNLTYNPSTGTLSAVEMSATSDENLKENIIQISNALNTVMQLKGVEYNWRNNGKKGMGLIAQDIEKIIPYLVTENENGKSVMYQNMIGLLIEAIKELKEEINQLKGDNK